MFAALHTPPAQGARLGAGLGEPAQAGECEELYEVAAQPCGRAEGGGRRGAEHLFRDGVRGQRAAGHQMGEADEVARLEHRLRVVGRPCRA